MVRNARLLTQQIIASCVIALLVLPVAHSAERDLAQVEPAQVGFSEQGLEKITAYMQSQVDEGNLAGVVTLASRHGKIAHFEAVGYRDLENETPMTKDTIFRIFSMTKPIAGVALMTLYDDSKFKLSDPVEKYIPEFKNLQVFDGVDESGNFKTVPADHPMTIRELMSHTGGLAYIPPLSRGPVAEAYDKAGVLDRNSTLSEMAAKLGDIPLNHQPGTQWVYSVSVDVQGYLVEVLSGQPFDDYLQEHIFAPLGMKDTAFYVAADKAGRLSRSYQRNQDGKLSSQPNGEFLEEPSLHSGGGGLTSTAADYARFAEMLLNEGEFNGVRILEPDTVKLMRTNQLPDAVENIGPFYRGNQFGLDFAVVYDSEMADGMSEGSYWWWGIAGTWFWIDPAEDLFFIGMIQTNNLGHARQVHTASRKMVYEAVDSQ